MTFQIDGTASDTIRTHQIRSRPRLRNVPDNLVRRLKQAAFTLARCSSEQ